MKRKVLVLVVGNEDVTNIDDNVEVEVSKSLEHAYQMIRAKLYDAVIVDFKLPDGNGTKIMDIYPHYRTIIVAEEGDRDELSTHRNGFYAILSPGEDLNHFIKNVVKENPTKDKDTLMALLNIQGSIQHITENYSFIKTSFNSIHLKLKSLEDSQATLVTKFDNFESQKIKTEQFYIDTLLEIKDGQLAT